jgi:hypothetical protein
MNLRSAAFFALAFTTIVFAAQKVAVNTADWKSFSTKDGKFTIRAPKTWGSADPNDATSKEAMEKIKANNPKMAKMFDGQENQFDLYLFDFSGDASKGLNNLNLKTLKDSGLTPALYPDVAVEVVKQTNMKNSGWKVIDLPAGKTLNYWGDLSLALGDGQTITLKTQGYLTVKENIAYICTMTTTPVQEKTEKPIFDAMAKTIVLK